MAGPTNWLTDRADSEGGEFLPLDTYLTIFRRPAMGRQRTDHRPAGAPPEARPLHLAQKTPAGGSGRLPSRLHALGPPLRQRRRRPAAGARLQHRPDRHLPFPRPGAAAQLSRLLFLAAPPLRRRCDRAHGQARQSRMAARQGAGAVRNLPARGGAWADAACLSVHRQRPRRRHPGQAPGAGGDHRPPDPAAHPRRKLRPAARSRSAGGRILRGRRRRSAPDRASAPRDPVAVAM